MGEGGRLAETRDGGYSGIRVDAGVSYWILAYLLRRRAGLSGTRACPTELSRSSPLTSEQRAPNTCQSNKSRQFRHWGYALETFLTHAARDRASSGRIHEFSLEGPPLGLKRKNSE